MKMLLSELLDLLKIHSPSGEEAGVITYLTPRLKTLCDTLEMDSYGNLYGELKLGNDPYTVLLNAHMDTVARCKPDPVFNKRKQIVYTTSASALGGDDKCGLAVHLDVLRHLKAGKTDFTGTVKVLFTREEEMGCIGASRASCLSEPWFKDINASIVVDRRGSDNIINGGWSESFCSDEYTRFWEDMAEITGFKAVPQEGTISDTMIFAEMGINSVNLSAGYYNAHTSNEYINVPEVYRVSRWVVNAMNNIQKYGQFPSFEYSRYDFKKSHIKDWSGHDWSDTTTWDWCDYCGDEVESDKLHNIENFKICQDCVEEVFGHVHPEAQ